MSGKDGRFSIFADEDDQFEDLNTYSLSDPNNKLTVSGDGLSVTATDLANRSDPDTWLVRDAGVDFFDGDIELHGRTYVSSTTITGGLGYVTVGDTLDTMDQQVKSLTFLHQVTASDVTFIIGENYTAFNSVSLPWDTWYYWKFIRDESIGAFGQFRCEIYTDEAMTVLVGTLILALTEKTDLRYFFAEIVFTYDPGFDRDADHVHSHFKFITPTS